MKQWMYSIDNETKHSVSEEELKRLVSDGALNGDVLIWTEGEEDWKRISDSSFNELLVETRVCAATGKIMAKKDMLPYGEFWLDPAHKEEFVAGLMSGKSPRHETEIRGPYEYRSPVKVGKAAQWLIIATAVYNCLASPLNIYVLTLISRGASEQEIMRWSMILNGANVVGSVFSIPAIVFYCIWKYRCSRNAHALTPNPLKTTPGFAVGWYFIPFANLWMPFPAMKEIYNVTMNYKSEGPIASDSIVNWWWGVWMGGGTISGIIGAVIGALAVSQKFSVPVLIGTTGFQLLVYLCGAILIFKIITRITGRQEEIFES